MPFRDRKGYDRTRKRVLTPEQREERNKRARARPKRPPEIAQFVGVDGEGMDTPDGRHIYTYMAAVNEEGKVLAEAEDPEGLSHEACVEMLLRIPKKTVKFGFMFSYDVTKIVEQMPLADRYYLLRPATRQTRMCTVCKAGWNRGDKACPACGSESCRSFTRSLRWRKRLYGFFNGSLSVSTDKARCRGGTSQPARSTKVWDVFRFFGCSFVEALKDWQVGTPEQIARIQAMKERRGSFSNEDAAAMRAYCREECQLLAQMMRKVDDAHDKAGIPLTRYEGAGSTATALLKKFSVADYRGPRLSELPPELAYAILCAFFGGRFENSTIGEVIAPVESYDISSAYPYALSILPCLKCGTWERITGSEKEIRRAAERADLAVVKFRVDPLPDRARRAMAWGPLPFRDDKGSICYGTNFHGWAWRPELFTALRWPHVHIDGEAWLYKTTCGHTPFSFLPAVYRQRYQWGKDGAGKALKLGTNAGYGKTAQTLGEDPPFQSFVWAGMTTASCRSQLLEAILTARDPWSVLAVATDGIYTTERLVAPGMTGFCACSGPKSKLCTHMLKPRDTGTLDLAKPLGGWEHKRIPEGAFFAKPGLYYRLNPTLDDVRARGVGRKEVFKEFRRLADEFATWDREDLDFGVHMTSRRFFGAKTSVLARSTCRKCKTSWPGVPEIGCPKCRQVGDTFEVGEMTTDEGKPAYGTWAERPVKIKFDPHPKRERLLRKGGTSVRLSLRDLSGQTSAVYAKGQTSPEGLEARLGTEFALEQPDWD